MNKTEVTLTGDGAIVGEVVREHSFIFAKHGFELKEISLGGNQELGLYSVFHFFNKRTGMEIRVAFDSAREGLNGGFSVMIIKPVNRKLDVEDFLKLHGYDELTKFFTYRDPKTDICNFANSFLNVFCELLDTNLKPILDSKTFEETPIDWMGYR
ncbi:MAG: hypothetical protein FD134_66 [Gallionellaceae bacterium]|nr:MAG: hypothetical protein FD134_66 [Gallionellaceae bacterium]